MHPLLDFTKDFDIRLFDILVQEAFDPNSLKKDESEQVLIQLKEHINGWTRVDQILKQSQVKHAQFFGLQILEHAVKTRWLTFTKDQRIGLRTYVIQFILEASAQKESFILNKFNIVLVEILKKEWPQEWPTFISDLIQASQTISMDVCRNSLSILKRLNDEIFIYSDNMTTVRKNILQNQLKNEYVQIFQLIKNILSYSMKMNLDDKLLETTFASFKSFCKWMGNEFLFDSDIIDLIIEYLNSNHSISSLSCLREIVENTSNSADKINQILESNNIATTPGVLPKISVKILLIHTRVVSFLKMYLSNFQKEKLATSFSNFDPLERDFVREAAFLLTGIYENNTKFLEDSNSIESLDGLKVLAEFSKLNDERIFKRTLEFWNNFSYELYNDYPFNKPTKKILRRDKYINILESLVIILITKMPRPEEVFITQNEYGEIIKEKMTEVEKIDHYKKMKDTLYHLSYLTTDYIKKYFGSRFDKFLSGYELNYDELNHICWAIGCISETMQEEEERVFFVDIIKDLLALCEMKSSKSEKAIVASNIMYIIGQYHRFLNSHPAFLKVLLKKLLEFMHESQEGIKDMACDTLLRITQKCGPSFDKMKGDNNQSMITNILRNLKEITKELEFYQKRIVYEALILMIVDSNPQNQISYLDILCNSFSNYNFMNENFTNNTFMELTQGNTEKNILICKELSHVIKSYSLVYKMIPDATLYSYETILQYFILYYEKCCLINTNMTILIKSDILQLLINVMAAKTCTDSFRDEVFQKVIFDFKEMQQKEPLILLLASEMVKNVQFTAEKEYFIINTLIIPSITILSKDPDELTDLSMSYFTLLESLLSIRFSSFFPCIFQMDIFNSFYILILTGSSCIKDISEKCLSILNQLLKNLMTVKNYLFFKDQYFVTMENLFGIIFDKDKTYNFDIQADTLSYLFVISNELPPFDFSSNNNTIITNYILNILNSSFSNITKEAIEIFIVGLFELCYDAVLFKDHIMDFRVKIYEFGNNEDLQSDVAMMQIRSGRAKRG